MPGFDKILQNIQDLKHNCTRFRVDDELNECTVPFRPDVEGFVEPEDEDHPAVYFRKAIPRVARELEIETNRANEFLIAALFQLIIDSANIDESVQMGLLEDITL